jgi:hypothetical protein
MLRKIARDFIGWMKIMFPNLIIYVYNMGIYLHKTYNVILERKNKNQMIRKGNKDEEITAWSSNNHSITP